MAHDPRADKWCMWGALQRAASEGAGWAFAAFGLTLLERAAGTTDLVKFNDQRTTKHADILATFDRAIELGRAA